MAEQESVRKSPRRRGTPEPKPYYKRVAEEEKAERKLAAAEGREPKIRFGGYYRRAVEEEAARQGLTVEEYGVYKGSVGSAVKPINSAGGLLAISASMTVLTLFSTVMVVLVFLGDEPVDDWGELTFGMIMAYILTPWSWRYYFVERRAERLRKERGKILARPEK